MKTFYVVTICLCMFAMMMLTTSGCKKGADMQTTQPPSDSTDTTGHPAQVVKSRNCIDSVIGIYYGNYVSTEYNYINGKKETVIDRSGLDTFLLSKKDSVTLQYITKRGALLGLNNTYKFDMTDIFYGGTGNYSYLYLFPAKDSIFYVFSFSAGTPPQDGERVYSTFAGKK